MEYEDHLSQNDERIYTHQRDYKFKNVKKRSAKFQAKEAKKSDFFERGHELCLTAEDQIYSLSSHESILS